jgi:hypothetical protein
VIEDHTNKPPERKSIFNYAEPFIKNSKKKREKIGSKNPPPKKKKQTVEPVLP